MNGGIGMSPLGAVAGRSDVRRLQSSGTTSPEGLLDDNDPTNITTGQQQNQHQQQHITRIRLVQFQKNTDEPMVSYVYCDNKSKKIFPVLCLVLSPNIFLMVVPILLRYWKLYVYI